MKLKREDGHRKHGSTILKIFVIAFSVLFAIMWYGLWAEIIRELYPMGGFPSILRNEIPLVVSLGSLAAVFFLVRRLIYGSFRGPPSKEVEAVEKKK